MSELKPNPITNKSNGIMSLSTMSPETAWEMAKDVVDYPVKLEPLFYKHPTESTKFVFAEGTTNTGRYTKFYGVAVDRNRTGNIEVISTVTDSYHTMSVLNVYNDLYNDLTEANLSVQPQEVYVSGNGGSQRLTVRIDNLDAPVLSVGKFYMALTLRTSYDGTSKHSITLNPIDERGIVIFGLESQFNFSTKHTKNVAERVISFSAVLEAMLYEWNSTMSPMLKLLDGEKFNTSTAMEIMEGILESSGIPEKHIKRCMNYVYEDSEHSGLTVLRDITDYLTDSLETRVERTEQFKKAINKNALKIIKKYTKI